MGFDSSLLCKILPTRNFCTQMLVSGVLTATGDTISQLLVDKVDDYNPWRTVKFAAAGMFIVVPIQFRWLRFLEKVVTGKGLAASTKKMLLDQSLMAPSLSALFITSVNFLNLGSLREAWDKTKSIYIDVMTANYKVWPAVQLINFTLIPLNFRIIFMQFFALFWSIYLSHKAMGKDEHSSVVTD